MDPGDYPASPCFELLQRFLHILIHTDVYPIHHKQMKRINGVEGLYE